MTQFPIADAHNDLLLAVLHLEERGHSDPFGDFWLPQLRDGGVALQVLPVFTEDQFVGEGALRRALLVLETARSLAARHSADVAIVETGDDLKGVLGSGRIALVLALEGAEPIGSDLEVLHTFFRLGVRMISLTWNRRTAFADGTGEAATNAGLTGPGKELVAGMEQLGVVLDVSHLSDAGFADVAELSSKPFVATHSSCRALQPHLRNLTDAQIQAVARSGGFVGLNATGPFLADEATADDYVAHIGHAVGLVGAQHVGLGPDFILDLVETIDPVLGGALVDDLPVVPGLVRPCDLATLGPVLERELGGEVARAVAGGSIIDFLINSLPAASVPEAVSP